MTRWLVEIDGGPLPVDSVYSIPDTNAYAFAENDLTYITSLDFEDAKDRFAVYEATGEILSDFFVTMVLVRPSLKPVRPGSVIREEDNGTRHRFVMGLARFGLTLDSTLSNPSALHPAPFTQAEFVLAKALHARASNVPHLRNAKLILSTSTRDGERLSRILWELETYLHCQLDEANLCTTGERTRIVAAGIVSNYARSLDTAKRRPAGQQSAPMELEEAYSLVAGVLVTLLRHLPPS